MTITNKNLEGCTISAKDLTYNGEDQTTTVTVMDGNNFLKEGEDFEIVSGDTGKEAKTYAVQVKGKGNYSSDSELSVNWTINKANIDIQISGKTNKVTYNGTEQSLEGYTSKSGSYLFDATKINYIGTSPLKVASTNIGVFTKEILPDLFKYNDNNVNANFTILSNLSLEIEKAPLLVSVSDSKVADNIQLVHNVKNVEVSGIVGSDAIDSQNFTLTTNGADAKVYKVLGVKAWCFTATPAFTTGSAENYDISYNVALTITNGGNVITIVGNSATYTYDGEVKSVSGYASSANFDGFKTEKVKLKPGKNASASGTDAKTYSMGLYYNDFYYDDDEVEIQEINYIDGSLIINPKKLTSDMVSAQPRLLTYNAQSQGPNISITDDGKAIDSKYYEITGASATNVGEYEIVVKGKKNYTGTVDGIKWSIAPANAYVNVNDSKEFSQDVFTYELTESNFDGIFVADKDSIIGSISTVSNLVGTYNNVGGTERGLVANITDGGSGVLSNYVLNYNCALNITKRSIVVKPQNAEFVYNGAKHSIPNTSVVYENLATGNSVQILEWSNNELTTVGSINNVSVKSVKVVDYAGNDVTSSYDITYNTASLTVNKNKIKIRITGNSATLNYDGLAHTITGYTAEEVDMSKTIPATNLFNPHKLYSLDECSVSGLEKGEYTMKLDNKRFTYNDENLDAVIECVDGKLTIEAKSLDACGVKVSNFVYNGLEQATQLIVSNEGLMLVKDTDFEIAEGSVLAATYAATYTITLNGKGNYSGSKTVS